MSYATFVLVFLSLYYSSISTSVGGVTGSEIFRQNLRSMGLLVGPPSSPEVVTVKTLRHSRPSPQQWPLKILCL